ncbi:hypothetical protein AC579_756 [Lecanosticta acicola]|uniref:Chromosome condensation protein n=1 Tax=Lecanosticta acicola TaxID=111012 RepID=A0AAI8Z0K2_9PEZI|nr:hypothetical protein AC579_756 [Lecanosticta acicola]
MSDPPEDLPNEVVIDDEDLRPGARRQSTSSVGSSWSRRHSHYDSQRISHRSRATSTGSQARSSTKSKGKRASYQQPSDYGNIDETAVPPPVPPREGGPHLEDVPDNPATQSSSSRPIRNFSQPYRGHRRRSSGANPREQDLTEVSALPPLPSTNRASGTGAHKDMSTTGKQTLDTERGDYLSEGASAEPRPFSSRYPDEFLPKQPPVPRWLTELYTVSYLIFFSILGTLARLGVQWIAFYPGAPITTPVVWANMAGSMIMGFLSEDQALFRDKSHHDILTEKRQGGPGPATIDKAALTKHKKTIPLYIGLATGFCGSFTSFSSFARDFFLALSNSLPAPIYHTFTSEAGAVLPSATVARNGGYSFEALLAVIIYTIALSLGGLIAGAHLAVFLEDITRPIPTNVVRKFLDPTMLFLGFGCWLGAVLLSIFPPDRSSRPIETWRGDVLFALVFAPLGCLLRFYASLHLNGIVPFFPLGTFAVNMFGTAVEGMCYDVQHVRVGSMGVVGGGRVGCQVLQGVQDGFCGCLTTVSTWVSEVNGLKRRHAYVYALATVGGGLCLMVVIMGSVRWTVGYAAPVCNVGYPNKVHG